MVLYTPETSVFCDYLVENHDYYSSRDNQKSHTVTEEKIFSKSFKLMTFQKF